MNLWNENNFEVVRSLNGALVCRSRVKIESLKQLGRDQLVPVTHAAAEANKP